MKSMENKTKHSNECNRVFKSYDEKCARCLELKNGAPAREGWQKSYFERKAHENNLAKIPHSCYTQTGERRCAVVCTFGEW